MTVVNEVIKVKIADYRVAQAPCVLITNGLGSCVGLSIYDKDKKIGGLAHIMLPKATGDVDEKFYPRYADTAIKLVLYALDDYGCKRQNMTAKIAGGSCMFPNLKKDNKGVGDRNVEFVIEMLQTLDIPLGGSDTGGDYGRSIRFDILTGEMHVRSIMHGIVTI